MTLDQHRQQLLGPAHTVSPSSSQADPRVSDDDHNNDDVDIDDNKTDDDDHVMDLEAQSNKRKDREEDSEPCENPISPSEDSEGFTEVENKSRTNGVKKKVK